MADRPGPRNYLEGLTLPDEHSVGGGGDDHTGLPVLPHDQEGSDRHPGVRDQQPERGEPASLRDDAGRGAAEAERQHQDGPHHGDGGRLHPGGDGTGSDGAGGEIESLSDTGGPDGPQFPDVADRHWSPATRPVAETAIARLRNWDRVLGTPEKLEILLSDSLDAFHEILNVQTLPGEEDYVQLMRLKKETAGAVLQTAVKLSDIQMEKKNVSSLERLLLEARREYLVVEQERAAVLSSAGGEPLSPGTGGTHREPEGESPDALTIPG